jgi:hypothetical protein
MTTLLAREAAAAVATTTAIHQEKGIPPTSLAAFFFATTATLVLGVLVLFSIAIRVEDRTEFKNFPPTPGALPELLIFHTQPLFPSICKLATREAHRIATDEPACGVLKQIMIYN